MMTEWLDIVDENDQVVGRDSRTNIHASGAYHRSSHILLYNTCGEIFVQLRSAMKDSGAGLWDSSAAGHLDSGETYEKCAIRELHEELGVLVDTSKLVALDKLHPDESNGFEFSCIYRVCSDQPLVLQPEEIDAGSWVTPSVLDRWIAKDPEKFTAVFKSIWRLANAQAPS